MRTFCMVCWVMFCCHIPANLNAANLDSLRLESKLNQNDSLRVDALYKLSVYWSNNQPDSGIYYAQKVMDYAEGRDSDQHRASGTSQMGYSYYIQGVYDSAIHYWKQSAAYFENMGNDYRSALINSNVAVEYIYSSVYDSAQVYLDKVIEGYEKTDSASLMVDASLNYGLMYDYQGNYDEAFTWYNKAQRIADSIGNFDKSAVVDNNIGIMFHLMDDNRRAISYYRRAIHHWTTRNPDQSMSYLTDLYKNTGVSYDMLNMNDSALYFHNKALEMDIQLNNEIGQAKCYHNIAVIYDKLGNTERAIELFEKARSLKEKHNIKHALPNTYNWLAGIYVNTGQLGEVEDLLRKSEAISREINSNEDLQVTLETYSRYYDARGDAKSALEYFRESTSIRDTLYKIQKVATINELERKYETEKRESAIRLLEKDREITQQTIARQRIAGYGSLGCIILLSGLVLVYRRKNKLEEENNALLDERNQELLNTNKELIAKLEANNSNSSSNDPLENFIAIPGKENRKVKTGNILYIQSEGSGVHIYIIGGHKLWSWVSLKSLMELLPDNFFIQTHRSYIINLAQVTMRNNEYILMSDGSEVPVAKLRRDDVRHALDHIHGER